jgi:integrase
VIEVRRGWDEVEGEIPRKSRQERRRVPIAAVLRDHLDEHLLARSDGAVFGTYSWVRCANKRARKRWEDNGLPTITLHEARHTFASFAIAAGLNAKTLSTYMGHANITITLDLYGHLLPGNKEEATKLLDDYFAEATVAQTVARNEEVAC